MSGGGVSSSERRAVVTGLVPVARSGNVADREDSINDTVPKS